MLKRVFERKNVRNQNHRYPLFGKRRQKVTQQILRLAIGRALERLVEQQPIGGCQDIRYFRKAATFLLKAPPLLFSGGKMRIKALFDTDNSSFRCTGSPAWANSCAVAMERRKVVFPLPFAPMITVRGASEKSLGTGAEVWYSDKWNIAEPTIFGNSLFLYYRPDKAGSLWSVEVEYI